MSVHRLYLFLLFTIGLAAAEPEVAVVLQFDESFSPQAWASMEQESQKIAGQAGLRIHFVPASEAAKQSFEDLVVFRMKGKCEMNTHPALLDERGPFAWAFSAEGHVLPFGEVKCDRIRESIKTAMHGGDHGQGDYLLGRALGRVVTHELYHILANTRSHGKTGVTRDSLSASQLIADRLDLSNHDCAYLREHRRSFR